MNWEDDIFLSAYMDGQLDVDEQQQVESAVVSNPRLAERLRGLMAVRDLVSGLRPDGSIDVKHEVMDRIRRRRRSPIAFSMSRLLRWPSRRSAAVAGSISLAAGIVLVIALMQSVYRIHRAEPRPRVVTDNILADSRTSSAPSLADDGGATVALEAGASASAPASGKIQSVALDTVPLAAGAQVELPADGDRHDADGDLELCRRMLDNPLDRRFFVVKDGREGRAQQQVASVVQHTTRFGFFRITIARGIVIDPRRPDEATVFALLVNPNELDRLRDQLKVALPDVIEETPANPGVVTMLADIGQVKACPPAPLGGVSIPREDLALRSKFAGRFESATHAAPADGQLTPPGQSSEPNRTEPQPGAAFSDSASDVDRTTSVASASGSGRGPDGTAPSRHSSSDPITGRGLSRSQKDSPALGDRAKAEGMIVVFVWVYKPPPS
jgi:anti-sigma factor RsiW